MISIQNLYEMFVSSDGISTDSRQITKNKIFFALKGDRFNGNEFASSALENGCSFAVVDDPKIARGTQYLLVNDTLSALQQLAVLHRQNLHIPVIGLTGSNGKTTTRELISAVLSKQFNTYSTKGNLNNHIGVPLSILSIKNHEMAVIEMGANHPGEIKELCEIAQPGFGLITNIGKAHLEGFGSPGGVVKAKKELYDFIQKVKGSIFINHGNILLKEIADRMMLNQIIYGDSEKTLCYGRVVGSEINLQIDISWNHKNQVGSAILQTQLAGSYNLENILAAITVGLFFNIRMADILEAISSYSPSNNRSQIFKKASNTLILDAYNANPSSMTEALQNLAKYQHPKKMVILGDMLELGKYSGEEHENILKNLIQYKDMDVYLVGPEFTRADKNNIFKSFQTISELSKHFMHNPAENTLILIKGSRGIQLEKVIEFL